MEGFKRVYALDIFRGFTISAMILVNTPGGWSHVYAPLRHARWQGCTFADLVFPFFLFIMGGAMYFSFARYARRLGGEAFRKVLRRVAVIFLIGLALNAFPYYRDYSTFRFMGVLQRIALTYGIAAFLCLWLDRLEIAAVSVLILTGYYLVLRDFGGAEPFSLETNLVRRIDLRILGAPHLWTGTGVPFDPEGLLSTLPAAVTVMFGYLSGSLIEACRERKGAWLIMILLGAGAVAAGKGWGLSFPVNKSLWTSSYVLYTAGIALLILAPLLWLTEMRGYRKWAKPLEVLGRNPLFLYILAGFWVKILVTLVRIPRAGGNYTSGYSWLYQSIFVPLAGPLNGSLLFALSHIALYGAVLTLLYRKNIFIKI
ncbi:MAG: DUF1624 domain-containing protein [Candidatus Krumholzibacteriota bacterium]|nr:DUF1624 domain-containing protein [Candidatus Krumholzibacteriota bacterium]